MIRVFLVDDHEIVRRGIAELLNAEPDIDVVGEAGTAVRAAS
jgi:two-component system response regulator DevR